MNPLNFHFVAQMSVERLLNCVVEGIVIAMFAWALLRLAGRRNSGTRFAVWFCALLAIVVSPFVESSVKNPVAPSAGAAFTIPGSWSTYLFLAWAVIAAVGLARVAMGLIHLRKIRKSCLPVDLKSVDPMTAQTLAEFDSVRPVELCTSHTLRVPTAVGFFRAAVVIPDWALQELSPTELHAVVLHELAHLRRWDDWTNLAQKLLRALFFFHPAVWFVESRLSLEREMACDDLVLSQTANPRAYAECLVSLAEKNLWQRGIAFAQAAVGRMRQTSLRVLQILDVRRSKAVAVWKPAPWLVAGFSVVCLAGAEHAPRLVAFASPAAPMAVATSYSVDPSYVPPVTPVGFHERIAVAPEAKAKLAAAKLAVTKAAHVRNKQTSVNVTRASYRSELGYRALPQSSPTVVQASNFARGNSARVIQASAVESKQFTVMHQAVFVVVDQQQAGDRGPMVWRVSVWRLIVATPVAAPVVSETSQTSI